MSVDCSIARADAILAAVLLVLGCGARTPSKPAPPAAVSIEVLRAPAEVCAVPEAPAPAPVYADDGRLAVKVSAAGAVTLDSDGASAGRVLAAIEAARGRPVVVRGRGAGVRIWATVVDRRADDVVQWVADVADLVRDEDDGEVSYLDPVEAVARRRARVARMLELEAVAPRVIAARDPHELAPAIAELLSSCDGTVIAAGEVLVVEDRRGAIEQIEALIAAAESGGELDLELRDDRRLTYGVPDLAAGPCAEIPAIVPDSPAGALVVALARARGEPVVVGCGGDAPASGALDPTRSVASGARQLGLEGAGAAFASPETAQAALLRGIGIEEPAPRLRLLPTDRPAEVAAVLDAILGGAIALPTFGLVAVAGRADHLAFAARISNAMSGGASRQQ